VEGDLVKRGLGGDSHLEDDCHLGFKADGSDGNFVAPLGIPVLDGMGAVGEGYHSEREYIFAESLEERVRLFWRFF
jgi:glutamate carboxypeptidase